MDLIPAIDLLDGNVVRLVNGLPEYATVYYKQDEVQKCIFEFVNMGIDCINIIDLNATLGTGSNLFLIEEILPKLSVQVNVGGGIHDYECAVNILSSTCSNIIVGSMAFESQEVLVDLIDEYQERIIVALDYKGQDILTRGWKRNTGVTIKKAFDMFESMGVQSFLITSVEKDGTLMGPDIETLSNIRTYTESNLISAGGIRNVSDLLHLKEIGMDSAVLGKALYERTIRLDQALRVLRREG